MDPSSQFVVPTIIDVPELIVTNEDIDFDGSQDSSRIGGKWFKRLKSLSSIMSYIIGLHNIWRFPYLCYKYEGGAFLIAYSLMLILIGYPLLLMEMAFGQYANEGPITIWRISPAFEGIGFVMCLISAIVAVYYNVINAWIIHYIFGSLSLSWSRCDNHWNSDKCFFKPVDLVLENAQFINCSQVTNQNQIDDRDQLEISKTIVQSDRMVPIFMTNTNQTNSTLCPGGAPRVVQGPSLNSSNNNINNNVTIANNNIETIINSTNEVTLPTNDYFHNNVLGLSESISQFGGLNLDTLIYLMICWAIVFVVTMRGLHLNGHLNVACLITPYLVFLTLLVRALTLEGSLDGIVYYLTPKWDKFNDIDIWVDATTHIFFAISPCWGAIITLASMNKFHNNFQSDALQIMILNYGSSIFIGLVSFSILGFMSHYSGIELNQLIDSGQGFIFMVYPEALSKLPMANLNSLIFFLVLLYLGLNSQLIMIETVITTIIDTWPNKLRYRRPLILMILCASMYLLGALMCYGNGFYILQWIDNFGATYVAIVIGIFELIAIAWIYGVDNFQQDIEDMISVYRNLFPSKDYWLFMWRYLTPSLLFAIILFTFTDLKPISYRGNEQPSWSMTLGWTYTFICLSIVPALAFVRFLFTPRGELADRLSYLFRPSEDWAPSSYISGPKLINRHRSFNDQEFDGEDGDQTNATTYSTRRPLSSPFDDREQDQESDEDLRVVDGRANYIIPEEEDDTDYGLVGGTSETNL